MNPNLFEEFDVNSKEEWLQKVEKDLKGKPLDSLNWHLGEELTIEAFYHPDDAISGSHIQPKPSENNEWKIGEDFVVDNPVESNKQLLEALSNGVDAPGLIFTAAPDTSVFNQLLKSVIPGYIDTHFVLDYADADIAAFTEAYIAFLSKNNIDPGSLTGSISVKGSSEVSGFNKRFPKFKSQVLDFRSLPVNPEVTKEQVVQITKGLDKCFQQIESEQIESIQLKLTVGTSYFVEIAKIRALRIIWSNLLKAYGVPQTPLSIDASFSSDAFDDNPNTNMIRSMTMAMSVVIGGVDRLTVRPAGDADGFNRRIARNVQHLLKMESYLHRVFDPAAGSFYIEKLSQSFAQSGWDSLK